MKAKQTFGVDNVIPYAAGKDKLSILVRFNNMELLRADNLGVYKLDIFRAPSATSHAMLLYSTGSKDFNILMRQKAKAKKMLLNQDGLYDRESNTIITTNSERDIFDAIEMEYKEPTERN